MISTILVATDGSEGGLACGALRHRARGAHAARACSASRWSRTASRAASARTGSASRRRRRSRVASYLKNRAEAAVARLAERARAEGVEQSCESTAGIADDRIVERGQQADLTVLGRDGQDAPYRSPALIGSTVDGVIRKTARSALVVPARRGWPARSCSPSTALPARASARASRCRSPTRLGEPIHVFVDSKDKGRAVARFEEVRGLVGTLPVPVREISSTLGRPDVKIVDSAREVRAGLIVMGAYGRNRITDYFLGSNSAAVVRTSPIAVLLAR